MNTNPYTPHVEAARQKIKAHQEAEVSVVLTGIERKLYEAGQRT